MYRRAVQANPYHVRSWYYLAQHMERHVKDYVEAVKCFETALSLNPRHTNTLKDYANLLFQRMKNIDQVATT